MMKMMKWLKKKKVSGTVLYELTALANWITFLNSSNLYAVDDADKAHFTALLNELRMYNVFIIAESHLRRPIILHYCRVIIIFHCIIAFIVKSLSHSWDEMHFQLPCFWNLYSRLRVLIIMFRSQVSSIVFACTESASVCNFREGITMGTFCCLRVFYLRGGGRGYGRTG